MYSMPLTFSPRWYTAHVTASTSSALGSRPSAFQRMLHDRAVFAAEILAFMGRSATMSEIGIRLFDHVAEAGAQFSRALHGFQAFGVQFDAAMILQHQSDSELARRDGF